MLEYCLLYNSTKIKFPSLFENVVIGSAKSFFQLDHQFEISLYVREATAPNDSRGLPILAPS